MVKQHFGGRALRVDELHPEFLLHCSYKGITLLSLTSKVYASVLERRVQPLDESWILDK